MTGWPAARDRESVVLVGPGRTMEISVSNFASIAVSSFPDTKYAGKKTIANSGSLIHSSDFQVGKGKTMTFSYLARSQQYTQCVVCAKMHGSHRVVTVSSPNAYTSSSSTHVGAVCASGMICGWMTAVAYRSLLQQYTQGVVCAKNQRSSCSKGTPPYGTTSSSSTHVSAVCASGMYAVGNHVSSVSALMDKSIGWESTEA